MVNSGAVDADSADAIRKRLVSAQPSYNTLVGKSLIDDQMRSHYNMVGRAGTAVDDSKPPKAHYDFLAVSKAQPKWKPGVWDRYVQEKRVKQYHKRMANTKIMTDTSAPEAACRYSRDRRRYRQAVTTSPGYLRSGAYEVMWSWTEEQAALRYLARHARAVSLQKGWTDSGPPEKAMAFRAFRRSFKKPAVLDTPPPKGMYGHLCDKKNAKRRKRIKNNEEQECAGEDAPQLPRRRSKTSTSKMLASGKGDTQLFHRAADDDVEAKRLWMSGQRTFVKKEISASAGRGSGGGLIGHGCRGDFTAERPKVNHRDTPYPLPKPSATASGVAQQRQVYASALPQSSQGPMYTLETGQRPGSRECLPIRRATHQLQHPRRLDTPDKPKSRTSTPTTFNVTTTSNFDAECVPSGTPPYEGLEGLDEQDEEYEEYEADFDDGLEEEMIQESKENSKQRRSVVSIDLN